MKLFHSLLLFCIGFFCLPCSSHLFPPGTDEEGTCDWLNKHGYSSVINYFKQQCAPRVYHEECPGECKCVGVPGFNGCKGPPGPRGERGVMGYRGEQGPPGIKGSEGDLGRPGDPGLMGLNGFPGERGDPGLHGPEGKLGPLGPQGLPGFRGPPGDEGKAGTDGRRGPQGPRGPQGLRGPRGFRGRPGPPGHDGLDGECGDRGRDGLHGCKGVKGEVGPPGVNEYPDICIGVDAHCDPPKPSLGPTIIAVHSQSNRLPSCPVNSIPLWEGYSLLHTAGESDSVTQDLGTASSCLKDFNPLSFMFCNSNGVCTYGSRNGKSFWLSTDLEPAMMPVGLDNVTEYISRCRVCQLSSPVMAVHSQTPYVPECPDGWKNLWNGSSFLMHSVGCQGGGQQLMSPGSCLEFRDRPYIECSSHGTCHYFTDKLAYWLAATETSTWQSVYGGPHPPKGSDISQCAVCQFEYQRYPSQPTDAMSCKSTSMGFHDCPVQPTCLYPPCFGELFE